jgi:transcriptional regulator with XRE-family HTH domain
MYKVAIVGLVEIHVPIIPRTYLPRRSTFGTRVCDIRNALGMTRAEFARRVETSPPSTWGWEKNGVIPRKKMVRRIATELGVSESFLRTGTDNYPGNTPKAVPAILEEARHKIAVATGLALSQIKVRVEFENEP